MQVCLPSTSCHDFLLASEVSESLLVVRTKNIYNEGFEVFDVSSLLVKPSSVSIGYVPSTRRKGAISCKISAEISAEFILCEDSA